MRSSRACRPALSAVLSMLAMAGCSGGGVGGEPPGIDRGGVIITTGPISGFGSVHVNGVRFVTSGAAFTIDDRPGIESDLRVGQVVRIEGTLDAGGTTGTATKVVFDDEVEGLVQSIDLAGSRFVVLGRTVVVGPNTSFDDDIAPRSLEGLVVGQRVEVSGLVAANGSVEATRIELESGVTGDFELKGTVASLNTTARTFALGSQAVSYATAQLSGFSSGQPAAGDTVEVKGLLNASGVLVASVVEKEDSRLGGTTADRAKLEGLVNRFVSAADFSVAGQRVTTTGATVFSGGTAADLKLDAMVEVEGGFDASGTVVASKIEFRRESDRELDGRVDSVNVAGNSLVVLGLTIRVNSLTRFEDHSSAGVLWFSLANIAVGDRVEVEAYDDGTGLVATRIERDDASNEVRLEGIARDVIAPNFTVAGVAVTTNASTEFRDKSGVRISAPAFFAVASGQRVKLRGTQVGSVVVAQRAELDD